MESLRNEIETVKSSRLMCLLNQALKWQKMEGILEKGNENSGSANPFHYSPTLPTALLVSPPCRSRLSPCKQRHNRTISSVAKSHRGRDCTIVALLARR